MNEGLDARAFGAWLDGYKAAWESRDAAAAAALFAEDATYRETPFDPPMEGRAAIADYWTRVTSGQRDVRFGYEILACDGDTGLCRWHAAFVGIPGGEAIELDGIFRCGFTEERLVDRFEEWWHIRISPPADGAGGR